MTKTSRKGSKFLFFSLKFVMKYGFHTVLYKSILMLFLVRQSSWLKFSDSFKKLVPNNRSSHRRCSIKKCVRVSWVSGSCVPGSLVPSIRVPGPESQGPRVSGITVPGIRVPGLTGSCVSESFVWGLRSWL